MAARCSLTRRKTKCKADISAERGNIMKHTVNSHSAKRFVSILCALLLLLCMLAPVSAIGLTERTEQIPLTTQAVAESFSVSAERISLLDEDDDGHTFFVMDDQTFVYMSDANRATAQTFTANYDIELAVPCVGGVMLGSAQPVYVPDCEHTDSDCCDSDMRWNGVYQFLDYETGEATVLANPQQFYVSYATGAVTVNYSTVIHGKNIPHASYNPNDGNPVYWDPNESGYTSLYYNDEGLSYQCHGFGLYIFDYLSGGMGSKKTYNNSTYTNDDAKAESFIKDQRYGTMVRAYRSNYYHTFIIMGWNSTGAYLYHANWATGNGTNQVTVDHFTWNVFADRFSGIEYTYTLSGGHSPSYYTPYDSKLHSGVCTCGRIQYESHFALTAGSNVTCVRCGYVGAMDGLNRVGEEIE